jgi:hypothetical protein
VGSVDPLLDVLDPEEDPAAVETSLVPEVSLEPDEPPSRPCSGLALDRQPGTAKTSAAPETAQRIRIDDQVSRDVTGLVVAGQML